MAHLIVNGRTQCVTAQVLFTDPQGVEHIILGRGDPRYGDYEGECLHKKLPVGNWKFAGGYVEAGVEQAITPKRDDSWPEQYDLIAKNALKELSEELHIGDDSFAKNPALQGVLKNAVLHYGGMHTRHAESKNDTHFVTLKLGKLTKEQYAALQETVKPGDDMIQSIIAPTKLLLRNDGPMSLCPTEGISRVKRDFNGFPEINHWIERLDYMLKQPDVRLRLGDMVEKVEQWEINLKRINDEVKGLAGIDEKSLTDCGRIGFSYQNDQRFKESIDELASPPKPVVQSAVRFPEDLLTAAIARAEPGQEIHIRY